MAAFTTMLALGLAGAAGVLGGSALAKKGKGLAPGAVSDAINTGLRTNPNAPPATLLGGPTPPATDPAGDTAAARRAAERTRRRAESGTTLLTGKPTGKIVTPSLQPRTLLGY